MNKVFVSLWLILFVAFSSYSNAATQPNIILIIADDLSWNDIGAYGHPTVKTPNLDTMASKGLRFDNAYLTASSCSPSRASILTGRYPHNTGAEQLHWPVPEEQITFSEKLIEAGYWTAAAGKWHLGENMVSRFDLVREAKYGEGKLSGSGEWLDILDERPKDKPFFLWLASWDAHRPFAQEEHPYSHQQSDVQLPPYYPATELYLNDFVEYYDEVGRFDYNVGKVVKKLEAQGVADNTLIIVMADNGRPYARDKTTLYDGGIKTPFIAYWPNSIQSGGVSESLISSVDIAPTFLELAKGTVSKTFEGNSFAKVLNAPDHEYQDFVISERNWHDLEDHGRTVRSKQFRYIRNNYPDLPATPSGDTIYHKTWWELTRLYEQGALTEAQARPFLAPRPEEEFYDLENDPNELNNLIDDAEYADVIKKHRDALEDWIKRTADYIPSRRTPDDFDRKTGAYSIHRERPRRSKKEMYGTNGAY